MPEIKIKKKKRKFLIKILFTAIVFYFLYAIISDQIYINELKNQEMELKNDFAEQTEHNEKLKKIIDSGDDRELLEEIARKELGYAYPNEKVYVDVGGK